MSLLDDVSIVVTPNGYKAGELYAVVPVPTEGSELITDGNFPTPNANWTIQGGAATTWVINNNIATRTGSTNWGLYQNITRTVGSLYKITFNVLTYTSGNLQVRLGDGAANNVTNTGSKTLYLIWDGSTDKFAFEGSFIGSIENVSVKEYTSADMDVTRATAATRVDENGLVNYAEILGGEEVTCGDFSCAVPTDYWVVPDGNVTFSSGAIFDVDTKMYQNNIIVAGTVYKFTYEITENTGGMTFRFYNGASYNFVDDSVGVHTVYFTGAGTNHRFYLSTLSGTSLTLKSVSVKEVTRDNVPRIDYTGGGCPHILAEPQRTNEITYSEAISLSTGEVNSGTGSDNTATDNYGISPNGTQNATRLVASSATGAGEYSLRDFVLTTSAAESYTQSVYLKSNTGSNQKLSYYGKGTGTRGFITVTNEWQRFEITGASNTTNYFIYLGLRPEDGTDSSCDVLVYGLQLEQASYATSYIPTSGITVTRNQDIFTRDGIGSLINDSEGTLYFEGSALENGSSSNRFISLSDGTSDNLIYIRIDSTASRFRGFARGSSGSYTIITANGFPQTDNNKIALVWDATNFRIWINGSERATTTINDLPVGMNTLNLSDPTSSGNFFGKVKQLQVYTTALTDTQLAALTS